MKKRVISILLLAVFLVGVLPVNAFAAKTGNFLHGYRAEGGRLIIHSAALEGQGQFQVTLGGTPLETSAQTVAEAGLPMTVYCLVDVSGSIYFDQVEMEKKVLTALSANLPQGSNMVISVMGNTTQVSDLLQTHEERLEAISKIQRTAENTSLYVSIVESIERLKVASNFHERRCLVVLSDGDDDTASSGYTHAEVESAVANCAIPMYTIAVLYKGASDTQNNTGKEFGKFARSSVGGLHFTPWQDGMTEEQTGKAICDSMASGWVLTASLKDFTPDASKDTTLLRVVYSTEEVQYEDTLEVITAELNQPPSMVELVPGETEEEETEEEEEPEERSWLVWVGVALAAAAVAFVILKKRKPPVPPVAPIPMESVSLQEPTMFVGETSMVDASLELENIPRSSPVSSGAKLRIQLDALRHKDIIYNFELIEGRETTVGRSNADFVLDPRDSHMSGTHCKLLWKKGKLNIRDDQSTNGTFVNGVPIQGKGWMPLENGSKIIFGSSEYRVSFRR